MTQADHYRDQSNRAKRLARAVNDPEASKKLFEMAEEFRLYAERLEKTHYIPLQVRIASERKLLFTYCCYWAPPLTQSLYKT